MNLRAKIRQKWLQTPNEGRKLTDPTPIRIERILYVRKMCVFVRSLAFLDIERGIIPKCLQIKLLIEAKRAKHGHYDSSASAVSPESHQNIHHHTKIKSIFESFAPLKCI